MNMSVYDFYRVVQSQKSHLTLPSHVAPLSLSLSPPLRAHPDPLLKWTLLIVNILSPSNDELYL